MSASDRKISRLPLSVFQNLIRRPQGDKDDPEGLKAQICKRLKGLRIHGVRKRGRGETAKVRNIQTIGEVLQLSRYSLMLVLDPLLTYEEVSLFLSRICHQCAPKPISVLEAYRATTSSREGKDRLSFGNAMRYIPTSLPSLDRRLCGGIRLATVTEFVGRSGVGKTQLALQVCLTAASFRQGAIYIDTEKKLSLDRLGEMSEEWRKSCTQKGDSPNDFQPSEHVLNNLTVHQPGTTSQLMETLDELEYEVLIRNQSAEGTTNDDNGVQNQNFDESFPQQGQNYPVRLLIVDSIAAPLRRDFGKDSAPQRAAAAFQCAQKLKRLADQLHLAIIVINQVGGTEGDNPSIFNSTKDLSEDIAQQHVRAALGMSWYHCVSTRLSLDTISTLDSNQPNIPTNPTGTSTEQSYRRIAIVKSNQVPYSETRFKITNMGIVEDPSGIHTTTVQ